MKALAGIVLSCVALVRAEDEAVRVATDANWAEVVEKEDLILVEFYAPWCGHCKQLAPKYEEAAKILAEHDPPIPLAKVDATEEKTIAAAAGVSSYPTMKIYRQGSMSDYNGPRETEGIVSYMKQQVGPSSIQVTSAEECRKKFKKNKLEEVAIVGYFASTGVDFKIFMQVAHHYREKFSFYHVTDTSILEDLGYYGSKSAITMFRPWAPGKSFKKAYPGAVYKQALTEWVVDEGLAPVGFATKEAMELYQSKPRPMLRAFIASSKKDELVKKVTAELEPIQQKHGKKLTFVINDEGYDEYAVEDADLEAGSVFVIEDARKKFKWTSSQGTVSEWVEKWATKQAEQYVKSEKPAPKAEAGEVQVVVGSTFNDIVMDKTKDVLIEFYAPWCGHCKALEPKYVELAAALKDEKNIVIAKMDATANDNTHKKYQASGFPTILYATSNGKDTPLSYDGSREVDDMVKWVKEHATASSAEEL